MTVKTQVEVLWVVALYCFSRIQTFQRTLLPLSLPWRWRQ